MKARQLAALAVLALLTACAAPYTVRETTNQFSDPTKPASYVMEGNRMFAALGDQLNGYVDRDRTSGKVAGVGIAITLYDVDSVGGGGWLVVRPGDEIVFLADNERLAVKAAAGSLDHSVAAAGGQVYTTRVDYAIYTMTPEQFKKVAFAQQLAFQINGKNGSRRFPNENFRLVDSFTPNLQRFYTEQIAPHL